LFHFTSFDLWISKIPLFPSPLHIIIGGEEPNKAQVLTMHAIVLCKGILLEFLRKFKKIKKYKTSKIN
jgi:hypothetical protein